MTWYGIRKNTSPFLRGLFSCWHRWELTACMLFPELRSASCSSLINVSQVVKALDPCKDFDFGAIRRVICFWVWKFLQNKYRGQRLNVPAYTLKFFLVRLRQNYPYFVFDVRWRDAFRIVDTESTCEELGNLNRRSINAIQANYLKFYRNAKFGSESIITCTQWMFLRQKIRRLK